MGAHVLLNLLKSWGKKIRCEALFNKFNDTGARMQDSVYHIYDTKIAFISKFCT